MATADMTRWDQVPGALRVLVVDDDEDVREALTDALESEGLHVAGAAADGPSAVFMADRLVPRVVLMDVRMPGMSGLDAVRLIKAHHPEIQVVVLSANVDPALKESASEAGAVAYLEKGIETALIADAIREAAAGTGEPAGAAV